MVNSSCDPKGLAGILHAKAQASGRDIFSEAKRIAEMDDVQSFFYESTLAKEFGIKPNKKGVSAWDKDPGGHPLNVFDDGLYGYPSKTIPKVYAAVSKKMIEWHNSGDHSQKKYNEKVASPAKTLLTAINKTIEGSKGKAEMTRDLARLGITPQQVYETKDFLSWVSEGGHLQSDKWLKHLNSATSKLTQAQALYNMTWTLGHGPALLRIAAHYASQGSEGFPALVKGVMKTAEMNPFKRNAALDKEGIYHSQYAEFSTPNRDPFSWGITAQKNLIYHTAKELGLNPHDQLRDLMFDTAPWDRPRALRASSHNLIYGLVRYPINETRWYFKTLKSALKGDKAAVGTVLIYTLLKTALYGSNSNIPAPIWGAVPTKTKEAWHEADKALGLNQISIRSGDLMHSMGIDAELDPSEYTQPGGGELGARLAGLYNTGKGAVVSGAKGVISIVHGASTGDGNAVAGGALNELAAASALLNLTGFSSKMKYLNSTTLTRILKTTGEQLDAEFSRGDTKTQEMKAVFGTTDVKKSEAQ